jgi:hypothetical protein
MPKTKKAPRPVRVAERMYGDSLGGTRVSDLLASMATWDNDELFMIANLLYLNLQSLDELRRLNRRIVELLEDIGGDTEKIADVAEAGEGLDEGGEEGESGEDGEPAPEPEPALTPDLVVVPPAKGKGSRKKPPLSHPVPDAPTPDGAA